MAFDGRADNSRQITINLDQNRSRSQNTIYSNSLERNLREKPQSDFSASADT
jgi:hypothetical protein